VLGSRRSNQADQMEIVLTVGRRGGGKRQTYEPYKFLVTEDSKSRTRCSATFGERIAQASVRPVNYPAQLGSRRCVPARSCRPSSAVLQWDRRRLQIHLAAKRDAASADESPDGKNATGQEIKLVSRWRTCPEKKSETRWASTPDSRGSELRPNCSNSPSF